MPSRCLQRSRPSLLLQSEAGSHLVKFYYAHGPRWALIVKRNPELARAVRHRLDGVVLWLERTDLHNPAVRWALDGAIFYCDKVTSMLPSKGTPMTKEFTEMLVPFVVPGRLLLLPPQAVK